MPAEPAEGNVKVSEGQPTAPPDMAAGPIGLPKKLHGYRIDGLLGRGGMGEIFLGWDERLHRHVAIKRIRADLPIEPKQRSRFRREARAVARLSHPAIVQIFDFLEDDAGDCIVMERIEGSPLDAVLRRRRLDLDTTLGLAREIAEGLAQAHGKGLVHRDLKPENVFVTDSGHAKILDFGLARMLWNAASPAADQETASGTLTQEGALVGTVHAMSPEQASGRAVDHRSDLFAFGGLLYEMLSGQAPFRGHHLLDTIRRVTSEEPTPLALRCPDVPTALSDLVHELLRKEPGKRPQNARLVVERLKHIPNSGVGTAGATSSGHRVEEDAPFGSPGALTSSPGTPLTAEDAVTGEWMPAHPAQRWARETVVRTLLHLELMVAHGQASGFDESAARIQQQHDERLRNLLARHGGVEVAKDAAFVVLFERPADAAACALAHQRLLREWSHGLDHRLRGRAALHLGEMVLCHNPPEHVELGARPLEVEGDVRNLLAQLAALASADQILLTRGAFDLARRASTTSRAGGADDVMQPEGDADALRWLAHGRYRVDGQEEPVDLCEVGLRGHAALTPPEDSGAARRLLSPSEERMMGWRPAPGQSIPLRERWKLQDRLGEGGFGEVWLAGHPSGERRVFKFCFEADRLRALKREVTLFRLLRDALGHRDDIARILDWQFDSAPFFVESEYSEGGDLVEWATAQGGLEAVPLVTRLELAADLAEALAAAHSVGVLHKDIKPENVLVAQPRDGRPRARLTDFGIGLLTDRERLDTPGFTAMGFTETLSPAEGSGAGTLGYLAPELMHGQAATVQADIYSLGVLVYQLTIGDFDRALAPGWERDLEDELLAADISSFVDGRPEQRPGSAQEVAQRLRNLEDRRRELAETRRRQEESVARQQALEAAQRRRKLATVFSAVSLVVLAAVTTLAMRERSAKQAADRAAQRATEAAERANREAETARQTSQFMIDLFQVADPHLDQGDNLTAREILERGVARIENELSDAPQVQAELMSTMGSVYSNLGLLDQAKPLLVQSLAHRRDLFGDAHSTVGESLHHLGEVHFRLGNLAQGEQQMRQALDIRRAALGEHEDVAQTLGRLGTWMFSTDAQSAELLLREAHEMRRRLQGEDHLETARTLHRWAVSLMLQQRFDEAEPVIRNLLQRQEPILGEHPEIAALLNNLALLNWHRRSFEEAESFGRRALALERKVLGETHFDTLNGRCLLASILLSRGRLAEAEALHRKAMSLGDQLGYRLRMTSVNRFGLAWVLIEQGDFVGAEPLVRRGLDDLSLELPETAWQIALGQSLQGEILAAQGRFEEAEGLVTSAYPILAATHSAQSPYASSALERIIHLYEDWGRPQDAAAWGRKRQPL